MSVLILVVLGFVAYFGFDVVTEINNEIQNDSSMTETAKNVTQAVTTQYPSFTDGVFGLALGLLFIGGLIAGYFSDSNPTWFIIYLVVIIFLMVASGLISNTWDEFTEDSTFTGFESSFPITDWVMDNFLLVMGVMLISGLIAVFMKNRVI